MKENTCIISIIASRRAVESTVGLVDCWKSEKERKWFSCDATILM